MLIANLSFRSNVRLSLEKYQKLDLSRGVSQEKRTTVGKGYGIKI